MKPSGNHGLIGFWKRLAIPSLRRFFLFAVMGYLLGASAAYVQTLTLQWEYPEYPNGLPAGWVFNIRSKVGALTKPDFDTWPIIAQTTNLYITLPIVPLYQAQWFSVTAENPEGLESDFARSYP